MFSINRLRAADAADRVSADVSATVRANASGVLYFLILYFMTLALQKFHLHLAVHLDVVEWKLIRNPSPTNCLTRVPQLGFQPMNFAFYAEPAAAAASTRFFFAVLDLSTSKNDSHRRLSLPAIDIEFQSISFTHYLEFIVLERQHPGRNPATPT